MQERHASHAIADNAGGKETRVIHLERVYYRLRGPARSRRFARVNTGSEHCYSLYDSLKTISRGTSSLSNPHAARLPVYNFGKKRHVKTYDYFYAESRGREAGDSPKFERFAPRRRQLSRET